jgi:hypothetical protein
VTDATAPEQRLAWGELLFALALVALGALTVTGARGINVPVSGADIGPRVFPYVVGTLLTIFGALLCIQVLRGEIGHEEDEAAADQREHRGEGRPGDGDAVDGDRILVDRLAEDGEERRHGLASASSSVDSSSTAWSAAPVLATSGTT